MNFSNEISQYMQPTKRSIDCTRILAHYAQLLFSQSSFGRTACGFERSHYRLREKYVNQSYPRKADNVLGASVAPKNLSR